MTFHGCYTALLTPMHADGSLDIARYEALIAWQIEQGIDGIVPCGSTGESATLSAAEHDQLIELAVKISGDKIGVMAGAGSNATAEAVARAIRAEKAGAHAILVVAPYYNKPTQEGIFAHYKAVADATGLPVFIYNIPGRSVIDISDATIARLAEACPNIAGVKDATGDLARVSTLRALVGDRLTLFSGEDMTAVGFNAMGGNGVISVTSNIVPGDMSRIQSLTRAGEYAQARSLHEHYVPLHDAMFVESNPVPVKYAASLMGKASPAVRLPLVAASSECRAFIEHTMASLGLIARDAA
jgi:4-hydroxy-tetrahydrodipicolinate synthase